MTKRRIEWIDVAKGLAILAVVVYHVWNGLLRITPSTYGFELADWLAREPMMAAFFFLAGVFILRAPPKGWASFVIDKLQVIIWPYLLWATLQTAMQILIAKEAGDGMTMSDLPRVLLLDPPGQFWFLYVLFMAMIVLALLLHLGVHPAACLALALLWSALAPWYSMGDWGVLYQLRHYFAFITAGVLLGPQLQKIDRVPMVTMLIVTTLASAVVGWGIATRTLWHPVGQTIYAVAGVIAVIGIAVVIDRVMPARLLKRMGQWSLPIFLVHVIAAAGVRTVLLKLGITHFALHLSAGIVAGIAIPMLLAALVERYRIRYVFTAKAFPKPARNPAATSPSDI